MHTASPAARTQRFGLRVSDRPTRRARLAGFVCRRMLRLAVFGLLPIGLIASPLASAEDDFPGVRGLMSDEEFRASGLQKLDEAELEALDAWLIRYTVGEAPVQQVSSKEVKAAEKDYEVVARLEDGFKGWDGKTIFRLDNGQVWQQRLDGRYPYRGPANPEVRIRRNWLGFYRMTLVEAGRSIGVTRLR